MQTAPELLPPFPLPGLYPRPSLLQRCRSLPSERRPQLRWVAAGLGLLLLLEAIARVRLWPGALPPPDAVGSVELVVAHHSEQLEWVSQALATSFPPGTRVSVYSKGPAPPPAPGPNWAVHHLPNVGREAHTFLHHLTARYENLSDITLFLIGSAAINQDKRPKLESLLETWTAAAVGGFVCAGHEAGGPDPTFFIDCWKGTTDNSSEALVPASPRPLAAWYGAHVGGVWPCTWCAAAMMAVSRERVRSRPRAFYEALLEQTTAGQATEVAHMLERSWAGIFRHPDARECMPPLVPGGVPPLPEKVVQYECARPAPAAARDARNTPAAA
eukprot:scaffold5.g992.t1